MGQIPEFKRNPVRLGRTGGFQTEASTIAQGISGLADVGAEIAFRQQATKDKMFVASQSIELERQGRQSFASWQRQNEADPLDKTPGLEESLDTQFQTQVEQAPSPAAAQSLERLHLNMKRNFVGKGVNWANQRFVLNSERDVEESQDKLFTMAFNDANLNSIADLNRQSETLVIAGAEAFGSESLEQIDKVSKRGIVSNTFQGMIEKGRLDEARAGLKSNRFDEALGVDEKKRLLSMLRRKDKQGKEITDNVLKKRFSTPWNYVRDIQGLPRVDQIPGLERLDFTPAGFSRRQEFIEANNKKFGTDLPLLTPLEEDEILTNFNTGNVNQQVSFLSSLNTNLTNEQLNKMGTQLFDKEPALAAALGVADDAPDISAKIIKGNRLIKTKGIKLPPRDFREMFDNYVQNSIPSEVLRGQIFSASNALVVQALEEQGKSPIDMTQDDFDDAMTSFIGPKIEINDVATLSFKNKKGQWVDEDDFEDALDDLTEAELISKSGGTPLTAAGPLPIEDLKNSTFVMAGDGQYFVQDQNRMFAVDSRGRPYILDMKSITDARPEKKGFFRKIGEFLDISEQ